MLDEDVAVAAFESRSVSKARFPVFQSLYLSVYLAAVFFADVLRVSTALGLMLCILSGDP